MNKVLEVFFDYACPYCMRAHALLMPILAEHPDIAVEWRPCEAHPLPDRYGPHSDLLIRGYFYARDVGADILKYHQLMYAAALASRADVENIATVSGLVSDMLDENDFENMLRSGRYEDELAAANAYAYDENGVWVVPAYRMNGGKLDAVEDIGVTKAQLEKFFKKYQG